MMDFTHSRYNGLLTAFREQGYCFLTFIEYLEGKAEGKTVILRHDVDRDLSSALRMAEMEARQGLRATYNFRQDAFRRNPGLIATVQELGHEIGYHYEELARYRGDQHKALEHFRNNLEEARRVANVHTIAMHGSPLSRYHNLLLWKDYDYRTLAVAGEAYLDVDYGEVFYLTDTGRLWNDRRFNLRDHCGKISDLSWCCTNELIRDIRRGVVPSKVMLNVHPGRWNPPGLRWLQAWGWQWVKNAGKFFLKPLILKR
jgi:hypothetical protein